jgi:adenine-specific DNA-methyltransferase
MKASSFLDTIVDCVVYCMDVKDIAPLVNTPIIYADPPYTKRQYAAYYHILETITLADNPELTGSTGLRAWESHQSPFCYKAKAPAALENLVSNLQFQHFFLSYSQDGQIPHERIISILEKYGELKIYEKEYGRYKSSKLKHKGSKVIERLYHLKRY